MIVHWSKRKVDNLKIKISYSVGKWSSLPTLMTKCLLRRYVKQSINVIGDVEGKKKKTKSRYLENMKKSKVREKGTLMSLHDTAKNRNTMAPVQYDA